MKKYLILLPLLFILSCTDTDDNVSTICRYGNITIEEDGYTVDMVLNNITVYRNGDIRGFSPRSRKVVFLKKREYDDVILFICETP